MSQFDDLFENGPPAMWAELRAARAERERDAIANAARDLLRACVPHNEVMQRVNNTEVIALRDALAAMEKK